MGECIVEKDKAVSVCLRNSDMIYENVVTVQNFFF
jgi:hypothetical protein